ncbi:MAG: hypothetical protein KBS57_02615 [Alistipes sp.]|nr:hypothetical protein [Candidatus Minthomonas equi]
MLLAVGYQHRSEGERFSSLVLSYPEVGEVYFPWVEEPSGRPALGYNEGDEVDVVREVLREELKAVRSGGRSLDLILNANCYGEAAMSRELERRVISIVEELDSWGCRPDIITAASPFVAHCAKRHFPEIETRASVNMKLTTIQAMNYLTPWFDSFYIGRDVQRNLDTLKAFSGWARDNGRKLGLLANSGCLRNCPWQTYHDNLIAHSSAALNHQPADDFNPHLCWTMYADRANLPEILKATWIRPEDLDEYAPYVDVVKLATRQHSMPRLVVDAYVSRSYDGNLLDLFEPGYTPAFVGHGIMLENSRFPSDWASKSGHCLRECTGCGYCGKVFDMIARTY